MIAQVSYSADNTTGGTLSPNSNATSVTNGQSGSVNSSSIKFGPLTDRYSNSSTDIYRNLSDGTHFDESRNNGVSILVNLWNSTSFIDNSSSSITSFNKISSVSVPPVSISQSGSDYTFSVSSGSSDYCWTSGNIYAPPNGGCLSTSSSSINSVRCFVKTNNNWQSTAQVIPFSCSSCKEGVEETNETYSGINMKVYPNPSDKDFRIEFDVLGDDTHVKLEFFDVAGRSVKVIADGSHAKGHFNYPITDTLPTGLVICQLKVGEIYISRKLSRLN